jgi:hypothetical protein
MRKWLYLAFLLLLLPLVTRGQGGTTTVTAIVLDPNGSPYTNSQVNITFFDPGTAGKLPLLNGSTFQTSFTIYATDSFAHFSETIPDNGIIDSGSGTINTQWKFSICYSDRQTCFVYQTHIDCAHNLPVTCTGGVEDLSAQIQAVAAYLPFNSILIQNNTWTGTNTFDGTTIFNGPVFVHNTLTIDPCDLKLLPGPVTICTNATAPRTWTIQDVTDFFVGRTTVDILSNKTINVDLNTLDTTSNIAGHYLRNNGTKYVDVPSSTVAADVSSSVTGGSGCGANQFAVGFSSGLNLACTQPAFTDLAGNIAISQMANGVGASSTTAFFGDNSWKSVLATSPTFAIKTAGGTGCTTDSSSNAACDVTFSWSGGAFSDTNYFFACSAVDPNLSPSGGDGSTGESMMFNIRSRSASQIVTVTQSERSVSATSTFISCIAIHP